jgi:aminoglycoside phosphotransferase (APT) family kinase protein
LSVEEGWQRGFQHLELDSAQLRALVGSDVLEAEILSGGLRNTNYRLRLPDGQVVLRLYTAEKAACVREASLLELLHDTVPVPRLLRSCPDAEPPWALMEFVDGARFDRLPRDEMPAAAYDAGHVLAHIHAFPLADAEHVDLNRYSGGGYGFVEFIERSLESGVLPRQLGPRGTRLLRQVIREHGPRLQIQDITLQHSDYKPWNLLARAGRIAAVLDWEFSFGGPRLNDVANFLRYSERQPPTYRDQFVRGYLDGGGILVDDWFRLARLDDLMALCELLSRPNADPAIARDVVPLIEQTIDLFAG